MVWSSKVLNQISSREVPLWGWRSKISNNFRVVCCRERLLHYSVWSLVKNSVRPSPSKQNAPCSLALNWSRDPVCHVRWHVNAKTCHFGNIPLHGCMHAKKSELFSHISEVFSKSICYHHQLFQLPSADCAHDGNSTSVDVRLQTSCLTGKTEQEGRSKRKNTTANPNKTIRPWQLSVTKLSIVTKVIKADYCWRPRFQFITCIN